MTVTSTQPTTRPKNQTLLFVLLCVSVWINYIDRGNLSVAAPVLSPELGLDPGHLGILLSSFFWTYSLMQPVSGWLVDRYPVHTVYAWGFAIWSVAVAMAGFSIGLYTLILSRLLLGMGESVAYPCYSRIISEDFPEHRRGIANAMIDVGTKAGPAIGTYVGGLMVIHFGWRWFFILVGGISLLWLGPWIYAMPKPKAGLGGVFESVPIRRILRERKAWATFFGLFFYNYVWYFLLTWLPTYLVSDRHFTMEKMSIFGALPFLATALSALFFGWFSDLLIHNGMSVSTVRRSILIIGCILSAVMLPVAALASTDMLMFPLVIAFAGMGMYTSNSWAITQSMSGKSGAGTWTGLQNCVGNMGGVVAPIVTGATVQATGSFAYAFYIAAAMLICSALCYGPFLGRIKTIDWRSEI